jgi:hypothetical protein
MIKLGSPVEFVGVVVSCGTTANEESATKMGEEKGLVDTSLHTRRGKHDSKNGQKGGFESKHMHYRQKERETCQSNGWMRTMG